MRQRLSIAAICAGLILLPGVAHAQQATPATASRVLQPFGGPIRVIVDPATGDRWLLRRDAAHPGGPGRWARVMRGPARGGTPGGAAPATAAAGKPVIHAGDRLIVEENTPVVEAHLEAVAMTSAAAGGAVQVRLAIGGAVLSATVRAPGLAEMTAQPEVQP